MFSSLSFLEPSVQSAKKLIQKKRAIPFLNVLSKKDLRKILKEENIVYRERIFSPLVTLWAFVSQILSTDHSCRHAVAQQVVASLQKSGKACSSITAAYCKARSRLPESLYRRVTQCLGEQLCAQNPSSWKWKGREVKIVDGSMLKLVDTEENQSQYPQRRGQKKGLGFPTVRILTVVSLSCGALIDAAFSCLKGKETGEPALLRSLISCFKVGDVVLFDRFFSGYFNLAFFMHHKIDFVVRQHHMRNSASMVEVKRLKTNDRILGLKRPFRQYFDWKNCSLKYDQFPPAILLREVTFTIHRKGFRSRTFQVITSLLNPAEYSADDILRLYAARWNVETDILNMKVALKMDSLRCKSPDMVRKEIWAHLMAYNFVRLVIAQAAQLSKQTPRTISFKAAVQILQAFSPILTCIKNKSAWKNYYLRLLDEVAKHSIGGRPGRYEPRVLKRRLTNTYPFLTTTRSRARTNQLLNKKGEANQYSKFARA